MKLTRLLTVALILGLALSVMLSSTMLAAPAMQTGPQNNAQSQDDDPLVCIDTWTGVHLAATALALGLGFTPFKAAAIAADGTAHWAGVELKHCRPSLEAPDDLVLEPAGCAATVEIPIQRDLLNQLVLDQQIIELILNDPAVNLPADFRRELQTALSNDYGYLANETSGEYSNIYFVVNPIFSTAAWPSTWGQLGVPDIYHFNSDVQVVMRHPGMRIDADTVRFPAGSHTVSWTADTVISGADLVWIPDLSGVGAAKKKAQKEAAKKTWKETVKGWFKAARDAAKDVYTDVAKNQARKTKKKLKDYGQKKLREKSAKEAVGFVLDSYFLDGYTHGKTTVKTQRIYVIDKNPPVISGNTPVTVEALEPGGVSSAAHLASLTDKITVTDDCDPTPSLAANTPRFWPLSLQADGSSLPSEIIWTARDSGAAGPNGGVNESSVTQQVTVVDTKPPILVAPPPVIMEATAGQVMSVTLGTAQVFDVADLRPTITNDAPAQFTQGIYRVNWQAVDFSGNVSAATKDTLQIVNLKEPGTNVLPTAFSRTGADAVQAISYEPVRITVRGQDGDPTPDPLWFSIEDQPRNGFFIAPLYPYFIDDYRVTARYSPQIAADTDEAFALQLATQPNAMNEFMRDLCDPNTSPHPNLPEEKPEELYHDFVNWSGIGKAYLAVDDDGFTYIYDRRYTDCDQNHKPRTTERISVWDADGNYFGEFELGDNRINGMKFDFVRGYVVITSVTGTISSASAHTFVKVLQINRGNREQPLEQILNYRMRADITTVLPETGQERNAQMRAEAAVLDSNGVLYAIGRQPWEGMVAGYPNPDPAKEGELVFMDPLIFSLSIRQSVPDDRGMWLRFLHDIAIDSENNVYVAATRTEEDGATSDADRIYKFSAATRNADGTMSIGEFIGWMGKCNSGPNCDYISQRSIGYSCTDETCFIDEGASGSGDRQGQFDNIQALAIDPNDILYVADAQRVQRFSPEGYVAGEARSSGDGSGFVLGDFGTPSFIAVNRGSFYVLDRAREIVHIFDAAVIHGIDEASAWVEYQSENNFVGVDSFSFAATDGFRTAEGETLHSPPATVEINVARNFRPPEATAGLAFSVTEDTPAGLVLTGYDIDGELDTLTFQVVEQPKDGVLSGEAPNLTYTPRANYDDEDSFTFAVSDGRFTSPPEEVRLDMVPVNDPPVVTLDGQPFTAGVGFPFTLQGSVIDPELADDLTVRVDWGDGTVQNEGAAEDDGTLSGPVINVSGVITRTLLAYHTYNAPGDYTLTVTVSDPAGAQDVRTVPVSVQTMADLALQRVGGTSASPTRLTLSYELVAVNLPAGGAVTAQGAQIRETLGQGLSYRTAATSGGLCEASGRTLLCTLDPLAPDATATVQVVVDVDPGLAVGSEVEMNAQVSATTPDPVVENNDNVTRLAMLPSADFLVDVPLEGADATPGDGLCRTAEGVCTLRAAVQEANALPGKQSIALPRDTYMLNLDSASAMTLLASSAPRPGEDAAASGDLDITDNLEILGLGADATTINANGQDRVVDVRNGAVVTIWGVALTGGKPADAADSYGGGLRNVDGTVTLAEVSINANESLGGGGIANMGGSLRMVAGSITGNTAGAGNGGGVLNQADLTLENVTVSGNSAAAGGGLQALGGAAVLRNVTMVSNRAANAGGAINNGDGEAVRLENTVVAGNSAPFGPVCGYLLRSEGHNFLDDLTDCTVLGNTAGNIVGQSLVVETMVLNRASTYSHPPTGDSPIVDAGTCTLAVDQRGTARPQGAGCDMGAFEFVPGEDDLIQVPVNTRTLLLPLVNN